MILKVQKKDSAYLYQLLESYEGLANYSTVNIEKDSPHREIKLHLAPDLVPQLKQVLRKIAEEIQIEVIDGAL